MQRDYTHATNLSIGGNFPAWWTDYVALKKGQEADKPVPAMPHPLSLLRSTSPRAQSLTSPLQAQPPAIPAQESGSNEGRRKTSAKRRSIFSCGAPTVEKAVAASRNTPRAHTPLRRQQRSKTPPRRGLCSAPVVEKEEDNRHDHQVCHERANVFVTCCLLGYPSNVELLGYIMLAGARAACNQGSCFDWRDGVRASSSRNRAQAE